MSTYEQGYLDAIRDTAWTCHDCGNTYDAMVTECPNLILDEASAKVRSAARDEEVSEWRSWWDPNRRRWYRICRHDLAHPDPEDESMKGPWAWANGAHGCDGCCEQAGYEHLKAD